MGITNQFNRQSKQEIVVVLTPATVGSDNAVTAKLPMGALITNVELHTVEAFDTSGADSTITGTITDGTTTFVNAQDLKSTGKETVAVAFKHLPQGGTLTFSIAEAATVPANLVPAKNGKAIAVVSYVIEGAGCSVYG